MTSPALHRVKEAGPPGHHPGVSGRWALLVTRGTLAGGLLVSGTALLFGKNDLAIGLSSGSVLSVLNFYGLRTLTEKILKQGEKGRKVFWLWNLFRWLVLFPIICWLFVRISPVCLLGAVVSYLWFLLVLGGAGLKWAHTSKTP